MDYNLLYKTATPEAVCQEFGIETEKKGSKTFLRCPVHKKVLGREDRKISNCILTAKGFRCFACGTSGNIVDMVAGHEDIPIESKRDYFEVAKMIAEWLCPEALDDDFKKKEGVNESKRMPFSMQDLAEIGLKNCFYTVVEPSGDIRMKDFDGNEYMAKRESYTLQDLYQDDPEGFYSMVLEKAMYVLCFTEEALKAPLNEVFPASFIVQRQLSKSYSAACRILEMAGVEISTSTQPIRKKMNFDKIKI